MRQVHGWFMQIQSQLSLAPFQSTEVNLDETDHFFPALKRERENSCMYVCKHNGMQKKGILVVKEERQNSCMYVCKHIQWDVCGIIGVQKKGTVHKRESKWEGEMRDRQLWLLFGYLQQLLFPFPKACMHTYIPVFTA